MPSASQKRHLVILVENVPTIAFLVTLYSAGDLRVAGWVGTILAALVLGLFVMRRIRPTPSFSASTSI